MYHSVVLGLRPSVWQESLNPWIRLIDTKSSSAVFSPDGNHIVYASKIDSKSNKYEVCLVDPDGTNKIYLADFNHYVPYLAWSPDGSKLAISVSQDALYIMNMDDYHIIQINDREADYPTWSPDGMTLAYVSYGRLYISNPDGTGIVELSPAGAETPPSWSPDGEMIVVATDSWLGNIYTISVDGTDMHWLTESGQCTHAQWSPR